MSKQDVLRVQSGRLRVIDVRVLICGSDLQRYQADAESYIPSLFTVFWLLAA